MEVSDFVKLVIEKGWGCDDVECLRRKILSQYEWLIEERHPDEAPYMLMYEATGERPFQCGKNDTSIDRFIHHYIPLAFAAD